MLTTYKNFLTPLENGIMKSDNESDLVKYMIGHKTDWAFRLLQKIDEVDFNVPTYIVDAVRWIDGRD